MQLVFVLYGSINIYHGLTHLEMSAYLAILGLEDSFIKQSGIVTSQDGSSSQYSVNRCDTESIL